MRKVLIAVAMLACFVLSATAMANTIKVSGNIQKEGKLTIDIDWSYDTAKYAGVPRNAIRQKVRDEIWDQMLPKIVDSTKGIPLSFDRSNFTTIKEYRDLVQKRTDGTKIYALKLKIEFNAPTESTSPEQVAQPKAAAPIKAAKEKPMKDINRDELKQRWDNEL